MKKLFALILLAATLCSLVSCGSGNGSGAAVIPDGMQIAEVGDGYTFYVPAEFTVERSTGITMAYVSPTDPSNVTLVRTVTDKTPADYFEESIPHLTASLENFKLLEANNNSTFGGKSAIYRIYTGKVAGEEYKFLQYLCSQGGVMYLLTYTAKTAVPSGDVSYYDRYIDKVIGNRQENIKGIVEVFSFTGAAAPGTAPTPEEPIKNEAGMILASDPKVSRYSFYVPASWKIDLRNGTTSVYVDGAVASVSYETPDVTYTYEYWDALSKTYSELYTDYTLIEAECSPFTDKPEEIKVRVDGHPAAVYVFTYSYGGAEYKTQKIFALEGLYMYVLTYTARADVYSTYLADFTAMRDAFTFD